MKRYVVKRKWLLHTFGGIEWWYKDNEGNTTTCWYYPQTRRTYFIMAWLRCFWLNYKSTGKEYKVFKEITKH